MDQYYIPKYLDAPKRILIFTIDEAILISLLFVIFVFLLKQQILAIIVCGLAYFGLKRLKGDRGPAYIRRLIYWHMPPIIKFKQIPPSYIRKFVG